MEGLEIKEINFCKTIQNKDFRTDSDFYTKEPKKNKLLKYDRIGNHLIKAQYGISLEMNQTNIGYPIYRMNEIHNMLCDLEVNKFADITNNELEIFKLNDRDVIFNRTNSFEWVGRTGLYRKIDHRDFVFASYLVKFIPNEKTILPEYLTAFLNTKNGIWDIKRRSRQSINQTNVNPEEVKAIEIPLLNKKFQLMIKNCFDEAHLCRIKSNETYKQAEKLLLEAVGLKDFELNTEKVNIKNFKDSFLTTGRLDAEYYQVKYDEIENRIKGHSDCDTLGNLILRIDTGEYSEEYFSKNEIEGLTFFIRSTNIKAGQVEIDDDHFVKKSEFNKIAKEGDLITARVGSVGIFGEIRKNIEGSVYSDNVLCFRLPNNFIPSVYTILFNTNFYFDFIDRLARGSVQQRLNQETLKDLIIPKIETYKQKQIAELVEESFRLKKESEEFLELAKRMVEVAIEEGEERAMIEPFLFSVETEKPEIIVHLSITKDFPAELFEDVIPELNKPGIITIPSLRENFVFAAATEWVLPTAVIVGFVLKSYADGFLNEMGKEHYQVFKAGIKKIIRKIYGLENKIISTKPIDPKNDQSNIFSIETATKTGKPVKFLFNKDVPLADWEAYVESAVDLMEQHYKNDENELDRQIAEMEQPVSNPIFIKYNKKSLRWEVVDMQKMIRAEYEAQKKMKK